MASLNEIRSTFLSYFEEKGHENVASSPLVPRNDPSLLFTNSGMVQFKNLFTGLETRPYNRAVTSQKCVRAGGKHNDLDNVGYTARHHTFFEMLGNFSFGDYFKDEAIGYCWDLVTNVLGVDRKRLLVTVYAEDDDAVELWKKHGGFSDDRIIRIATSDNFWSMGPTGPCGPCTELFYDYGEQIPGGPPGSADEDGDRFVEIWNLVFMQFEQFADGTRGPLPKPSIDTGMGLERIGALLQGTNDNYATDLFTSLIIASADATNTEPYGPGQVHHRVIADHLRSSAFLIADGVLPSRDGRGYVLRRIMRRAMRHVHMLGEDQPVMHRIVPTLVRNMGSAFPELSRLQSLIEDTLLHEETRFKSTLHRGLRLLEDELEKISSCALLPGEVAFRLYDTYGFPLDLTQDALRERGRLVDVAGFDKAMAEQKKRARAAWVGSGEISEDSVWLKLNEQVGANEFLGYETDRAEARILAIVADGRAVESAEAGQEVDIIVNQTPFYAEAGGQVGDCGWISSENASGIVKDSRKRAGVHVHSARIENGTLSVGDAVELVVDAGRRERIKSNHSATHLLHAALRSQLGLHVHQRGSLNAADRLRFDFSHPKPMNPQEIEAVEAEVNRYIRQNSPVETRVMEPEAASEIGALALFGEKYGDEVRVVAMGENPGSGKGWSANSYSLELCGGTHVGRTGEICVFVTTGESASSAGVRRIEALTGEAAREYLVKQDYTLAEITLLLKAQRSNVVDRVRSLVEDRKRLQGEIERLRMEMASATSGNKADGQVDSSVAGVTFRFRLLSSVPARKIPSLIDEHKADIGSGVILLVSDLGKKVAAATGVTDDLTGQLSAVDMIRIATPFLGGKGGGGRQDFAQGGGTSCKRCKDAVAAIEEYIGEKR